MAWVCPALTIRAYTRFWAMVMPITSSTSIPPCPAPYIRAVWGWGYFFFSSFMASSRPVSSKIPAASPP